MDKLTKANHVKSGSKLAIENMAEYLYKESLNWS